MKKKNEGIQEQKPRGNCSSLEKLIKKNPLFLGKNLINK